MLCYDNLILRVSCCIFFNRRLAIIDITGLLTFLDMDTRSSDNGQEVCILCNIVYVSLIYFY